MKTQNNPTAGANKSNANSSDGFAHQPNEIFNYSNNSTEHLVDIKNSQLITTSRKLSNQFRKRHKAVLRDIDNLIEQLPEDLRKPNFVPLLEIRHLPNGGHKEERYFELTRDAFTLLAMGFTGKDALMFKLKYIKAFNLMENELIKQFLKLEPKFNVMPIIHEEQYVYPYTDILKNLNAPAKSSASKRKAKHPQHFFKLFGRNFITSKYCDLLNGYYSHKNLSNQLKLAL